MHVSLIGGGWTPDVAPMVFGPFLDAARRCADGAAPRIACIVIDEGDGSVQFERFAGVLDAVSPCVPYPALTTVGSALDVAILVAAHGVLVCGGLTPAYADALSPHRDWFRRSVHIDGVAYAGFSAGASVAARHAVVGGWRHHGIPICPEFAGEDMDEVAVVPGLALVDFMVDVHAAQWGTAARVRSALSDMPCGSTGLAIDEDTAVVLDDRGFEVAGKGRVAAFRVSLLGAVDEVDPGAVRSLRQPGSVEAAGSSGFLDGVRDDRGAG